MSAAPTGLGTSACPVPDCRCAQPPRLQMGLEKAARPAEGSWVPGQAPDRGRHGWKAQACSPAQVPRQTHVRTDHAFSKETLCPAEPRGGSKFTVP